MNAHLKSLAALALASALAAGHAQTTAPAAASTKKQTTHKRRTAVPPKPSVESQIEQLRQETQSQIDQLKQQLSEKDQQLQQAQQAAAAAQAAAEQAQQQAAQQASTVSQTSQSVTSLQSAVTDLQSNTASLVSTVQADQAKVKKDFEHPDSLHYKGITLTPGGFLAGETVNRTKATGGDIPTPFSSLPYEHSDLYTMSEFYGSARQSRLSLLATGKVGWGTLTGYAEGDFLGTGITSNNNESNSYVFRQRILYADATTNDRWTFVGGQLWSLATEQKKGITSSPADVLTPLTIDPNYVPGFVWTRQYGFRVVKNFDKWAAGISLENPQTLYTTSLAGDTPYAVLGSQGTNGGNYNAAVSSCSPSTSIVNYTNQTGIDSAGNVFDIAVPVYKTVNSCANITNISFNKAPDILVKATFDPGFGHYEIFGIGSFTHETVYPGETTNGNLYGGLKDIETGLVVTPSLTTAGAYENSIALGGLGGSLRVPITSHFNFGVKGLFGPGVGRYGATTLSDVTANSAGELEPIHNVSALLTLEAPLTPRLILYADYGGDYAGREDFANSGATTLGAPSALFCPTTPGAFTCTTAPTAADIAAGGSWGAHWGTPSAAAVGYGSRLLNNSACNTNAAPGYNGSSTGFYPGGSCGAQTRDVQELTLGWWYDIYKGDRGRLRQGFQYAYAVREGWSGASGIGAKGIDNMFWTSFRYYIP